MNYSQKTRLLSCILLVPFLFVWNLARSDDYQEILRSLYEAVADYRKPCPAIFISQDQKAVARYHSRQNLIELEEDALRVCRSFGPDSSDALAFILGHELVHSQQQDIFHEEGKTNYLAFYNHTNTKYLKEAEADVQGLFSAYLAGFDAMEILPELVDSIYLAYDLTDSGNPDYPPYLDRRNFAKKVRDDVTRMIDIYEASNYLAASGHYSYALSCLNYIEGSYKGRELYNNLGVIHALEAMNFSDEDVDLYLYPLELDWDSRMKKPKQYKGAKGLDARDQLKRIQLLTKAQRMLAASLQRDSAYARTNINYMLVLTLLGKPKESLQWREDTLPSISNNWSEQELAALQMAYALACAKSGDEERRQEAALIWKGIINDALSKNQYSPELAFQAAYNYDVFYEGPPPSLMEDHCPIESELPPPDPPKTLRSPVRFFLEKERGHEIRFEIIKAKKQIHYSFLFEDASFLLARYLDPGVVVVSREQKKGSTLVSIGRFIACPDQQKTVLIGPSGNILEYATYEFRVDE